MNEEYLWNREGETDPEIESLEQSLTQFQYRPKPLRSPVRHSRFRFAITAALAALAVLVLALSFALRSRFSRSDSGWTISWNNAAPRSLAKGQTISTGSQTARLQSGTVGTVQVDPQSVLRLVDASKDNQRLALDRGVIHAFIWAPPRRFVVDTPSSSTVDLGCEYTLHVLRDGTGMLRVDMGWVAFEYGNVESFIPEGAACTTRPGHGPGTPYVLDAPADLKSALARFDETRDLAALRQVLADARPGDALTLWHLLTRTEGAERAAVFERFSAFVKLPPAVTEQQILAGDPAAINASWNALGLGSTAWWREWKRRW